MVKDQNLDSHLDSQIKFSVMQLMRLLDYDKITPSSVQFLVAQSQLFISFICTIQMLAATD